MVKFGKQFALALAELSSLHAEAASWPCIDYRYHKDVLWRMIETTAGSKPPLVLRSEISGEEPILDRSADGSKISPEVGLLL